MGRAALTGLVALGLALSAAAPGAAAPSPADSARLADPEVFPSAAQIRAAGRFIRGRRGVNSFALIDSRGRLHGSAPRRTYASASVTKAMLLVAYLRRIDDRLPSRAERGALGPMITASDNDSASAVYRRVGDPALRRLAGRARMRRFSVAGRWSYARISAEDQARFMLRIDRLVPARSRGYARRLLSSIVPRQRWGFSRYSLRAGWNTFLKGGWRGKRRDRLVHEVALFERAGRRFSLAVLTDRNPSHRHGTATLRGVASRLFDPA